MNQLLLQKLLVKYGFTSVDTAENGEAALEAVKQNTYGIIFMDCQMPVMDGYKATQGIRRHEASTQRARSLITAMTANAMNEDRDRCFAAGMDEYITKPIDPIKLTQFLCRWFISDAYIQQTATCNDINQIPVDLAAISHVSDNSADLQYLLDMFFTISSDKINAMRLVRRLEEQSEWHAIAHYLKGSAASMGMAKLAALCEDAEQKKSIGYNEKRELVEAIAKELERCRNYIYEALA